MKRTKKVFGITLGVVLMGFTAYYGYRSYNVYAQTNERPLYLDNIEVLAQNETPKPGRPKQINNDGPCTVKETYECVFGFTIYDSRLGLLYRRNNLQCFLR